jgi:hypothetical protein
MLAPVSSPAEKNLKAKKFEAASMLIWGSLFC